MIVTTATGKVFELGTAPRYMNAAAFTIWGPGSEFLKTHKTVEAAHKATDQYATKLEVILPD